MKAPSVTDPQVTVPLRRASPPHEETWHIVRPALVADLEAAIRTHRVVVLHALTGYGKTIALAAVARRSPGDSLWLTLDPGDRDAEHLVRDLKWAATVGRHDQPGTAVPVSESVSAGIGDIIRLANFVAFRSHQCVVFLDDLHALRGAEEALSALGHLVRFTPDHIRFVIGTRWWDGGASLGIAHETMAVRGYRELALSEDDIEDALALLSIPTAHWNAVVHIAKLSHGWPAITGELFRILHSRRPMLPQGLELLLDQLAEGAIGPLLASAPYGGADLVALISELEVIHPELLSILGHGSHLIEAINWLTLNGVVTSNHRRSGYLELNPLVRRYVLTARPSSALDTDLHLAAARWYASHGELVLELDHRLLAGDIEGSADLVDQVAAELSGPEDCIVLLDILSRYERMAPRGLSDHLVSRKTFAAQQLGLSRDVIRLVTDVLEQRGASCTNAATWYRTRALAFRNVGEMAKAFEDIDRAVLLSQDQADTGPRCLHVRATLRGSQLQSAEAQEDFTAALRATRDGDQETRLAYLLGDIGCFQMIEGLPEEAIQTLTDCMEVADSSLHYQSMAISRNGLGLAWQAKGDLAAAERWFREAMLIARGSGQRIVESLLWLSLADLAVERGHGEEGRRMYRRALAIATIVEQPGYVSYALSGLAGIERMAGRLEEAGRLIVEASQHLKPEMRHDLAVLALRKAHLHIDEGNYGLAFEELDPTIEVLRVGRARMDLARGLMLRADAAYLAYGLDASYPDLAEILGLVEEIGTSQFLAPYCRRMPRLLRALAASQRGAGYAAIIGLGVELPPERRNGHVTPIARVDDPDPSLLDARELDVVLALCDGLSREEVAARVGRSLSTVHKLIHGIYTATGFRATHQIVAWAFRRGLYRPGRLHD